MLLTFQYQLYNPQSIQKPLLGFFIIIATTTEDIRPPGERHLNHVIIEILTSPLQAVKDKTDAQVRQILTVSPFMQFFLGVSLWK